jgi:thiol-disulfide isomerase/thioredoxin
MEKNNNIESKQWINERLSMLPAEEKWQPDLSRGLGLLRTKLETRRNLHSRFIWPALCALTIIGLLMTFPTTRLLAARYWSTCLHLLRRTGEPGLEYTSENVRGHAPDLAGLNDAGASVALSTLRGKVVLFSFWKEGCDACEIQKQWFTEFQRTYDAEDFVFLHRQVAIDDDLVTILGRHPTVPAIALIDKSGRIAVTHAGLCTKREYQTAIETLLNEK